LQTALVVYYLLIDVSIVSLRPSVVA